MFKKMLAISLIVALMGLVAACDKDDDHHIRGNNNNASCYKDNHGNVHCDNGRYGSSNKQVNANCHKDWKGDVHCDKD